MDLNIGSFFGDKDLENMMNRVDTLVGSLSKQKKNDVTRDVADIALKEILKSIENESEGENFENNNDVQKLFEKLSISPQRLARYSIYDELYSAVQIFKRIIKVYINNILQRDVLTGKVLDVKVNEDSKTKNEDLEAYKIFINLALKYFRIDEKLKDVILHQLLKYGDQYIEIIDLKEDVTNLPKAKDSVNTSSAFLLENELSYIESRLTTNGSSKDSALNDCINHLSKMLIEIQEITSDDTDVQNSLFEANSKIGIDVKGPSQFNDDQFQRILLRYHKPNNIMVLSTTYSSIVGYVEISESKTESTPNVGLQFAKVMKQITRVAGGNPEQGTEFIIRSLVKKLIVDLVKKMKIKDKPSSKLSEKENNERYERTLQNKLGDDLFYTIKRLFVEVNSKQKMVLKKMFVRYIPKERMVRICNNPVEYFPYGTSVLDSLVYPGKLYLLTQLTNVVSKLSRAALIRKWTVETGPREHQSGLIQKLKRELKNQRISVDDLMNFKSIPRILSDFKDIILLTKKGQRFVDMDLQNMHDANIKVADLEDTRREIIALSGIPAPYLGYQDVVELR